MKSESGEEKISPEFAARLAHIDPGEQVRAVVLLRVRVARPPVGGQRTPESREAALEATRALAEQGLVEIDAVLERFGGQRLAKRPDVLGSMPVQTTAAGVAALAECERVAAILEDQPALPLE